MNKFVLILIGFMALFSSCNPNQTKISTVENRTKWVDSIYDQMSIQEKVGQLFMVATYSNRSQSHCDSIQKLVKENAIGGLIFFQGGPVRQVKLTNTYQALAKVPLMIGMDAEWGVNMRLDSTLGFPYNMTLGAIKKDELIQRIGQQIGKHNKRLGVHLNFAPVVDINTNPGNPIIGVRSFGEDKVKVTNKAIAYMEGMQAEGVLACAKHFPGHGDTSSDSHKTLPTVSFSADRIDSIELYPYKQLFKKDVASVMVAHLNVPSLEESDGLPSSLSYTIISNLLKKSLAFKGLILTDALNMKGVANFLEPGDVDLAAFKAGNDMLLFSENSPKAISKIIAAYTNKEITEDRLEHSVKKILGAKYDVNLQNFKPIDLSNLVSDLNHKENIELYEEAIASAITIVKNENNAVPLRGANNEKIAYIKLGDGNAESFVKSLQNLIQIDEIAVVSSENFLKALKKYNKVIIGYHRENVRSTHTLSIEDKHLIEKISKQNEVILNVHASQYTIRKLNFEAIETVIVSYENSDLSQKMSAQIILGKRAAVGKLPASINKEMAVDCGIITRPPN